MKYNEKRNNTRKEDPMVLAIGGAGLLIFVVLFCVIVWVVTHRGGNDIVIDSSSVVTELPSSGSESRSDSKSEDSSEESSAESAEEYDITTVNDMGLVFTEVNEKVTAVDVTNLRSEPSTAQGQTTVVTQLHNGEVITRIGIEETTGWSKLIYDGRIVYASTNYLQRAEAEE